MFAIVAQILVYLTLAALVPLTIVTGHQAAQAHAEGVASAEDSTLTPTLY
jgi:hypothetical protein